MVKSFKDYWGENIKIAKEGYELTLFICGVAAWVIGFGCKVLDLIEPNWKIVSSLGFFGAGLFFFAWCFLWLPVRRHETERLKYEAEWKRHEGEVLKLEKSLQDLQVEHSKGDIAAERDHDKQLFNKLNNILDEQDFRLFWFQTTVYHYYDGQRIDKCMSFFRENKKIENYFLNVTIKKEIGNFLVCLENFLDEVTSTFFEKDGKYMLQPECKHSRNIEE